MCATPGICTYRRGLTGVWKAHHKGGYCIYSMYPFLGGGETVACSATPFDPNKTGETSGEAGLVDLRRLRMGTSQYHGWLRDTR